MTHARLRIYLLLCILLCAGSLAADPQSKSFSIWRVDADALTAYVSLSAWEAGRLGFGADGGASVTGRLAAYLPGQLQVQAGGRDCDLAAAPRALRPLRGNLRIELHYDCPMAPDQLSISNRAFFELTASHVHFARVDHVAGSVERLYTSRQQNHDWLLSAGSGDTVQDSIDQVLPTYLVLGFEHILIGIDHLAFLLTLLLLGGRVRDVVFVVTGFTLGHSITLSLAVLGVLTPDAVAVESMIGFTIALVAAENIAVQANGGREIATGAGSGLLLLALVSVVIGGIGLSTIALLGLALFSVCYLRFSDTPSDARRLRPLITVVFGLVHGFGFASVLQEVGLPRDDLPAALFGFNVGVELGQIVIVVLLWMVGQLAMRWRPQLARWRDLGSVSLCGLGCYWFLQRALI